MLVYCYLAFTADFLQPFETGKRVAVFDIAIRINQFYLFTKFY